MSDYHQMSEPRTTNAARDPFYVVKDKVETNAKRIKVDMERWKDLLETTNTATNKDFISLTNTMKTNIKRLKGDIQDLSQTIDIVEKSRVRFRDIDDEELGTRKLFVTHIKDVSATIQSDFTSERAKQKLEQDRRLVEAQRQEETGMDRERVRMGEEVVASRMQQEQEAEFKQDEILLDMSEALGRLGNVAQTINAEFVEQERIIEDLNTQVDQTNATLEFLNKKLDKLLGKSAMGKYICILFLFVVVVILFFAIIYT